MYLIWSRLQKYIGGHISPNYTPAIAGEAFIQTSSPPSLRALAVAAWPFLMDCYESPHFQGSFCDATLPPLTQIFDEHRYKSLKVDTVGDVAASHVSITTAVRSLLEGADMGNSSTKTRLAFTTTLVHHFPFLGHSALPSSWQQPALLHAAICSGAGPDVLRLFAPCVNESDDSHEGCINGDGGSIGRDGRTDSASLALSCDSDGHSFSPLLLALKLFEERKLELVQRQVRCLLSLGADPNIASRSGETPLDVAASLCLDELVVDLIQAGASGGASMNNLVGYFKHLLALPLPSDAESMALDALASLVQRSRALHWHLSLDTLLPHKAGDDAMMVISSEHSNERCVPMSTAHQLIDEHGGLIRVSQFGRRAVGMATSGDFALYFKFRPEVPGLESAAGIFSHLLFGDWTSPFTELVRWHESMPVLVSQEIRGLSLHDVLLHHPERLSQLDAKALSQALIVAMLVNPEDGKPDNYILEPFMVPGRIADTNDDRDGRGTNAESRERLAYRLVCIDNDHSFVPAVTVSVGSNPALHVKCVLFCLEQMFDTVHPDVQSHLAKLDIMALTRRWLEELRFLNRRHHEMFARVASTLIQDEEQGSFLGCPLRPGVVCDLVNKLCRLQQVLREPAPASHLALLMALDPLLGMRYDIVLQRPMTVLERFKEADGAFFARNFVTTEGIIEEHFVSKLGIPHFLKSLDAHALPPDVVMHVLTGQHHSPIQGLAELQLMASDYARYLQYGVEAFLHLARTQPAMFGQISIVAIQEEVLRVLDCSQLPLASQFMLLRGLQGKDLRHLVLMHCDAVTDEDLRPHVAQLPNLTSLRMSACSRLALQPGGLLRSGVLSLLSSKCLALVALSLSELPMLEELKHGGMGKLTFPSLRLLKVTSCPRLREVVVAAPELGSLSLAGDSSLVLASVYAPQLQSLDVTGCTSLNPPALSHLVASTSSSVWQHIDSSYRFSDIRSIFPPAHYSFFQDMVDRQEDAAVQERMLLSLCGDTEGVRRIATDPGQLEEAVSAILSSLLQHATNRKIQSLCYFILGTLWPSPMPPPAHRFTDHETATLLAFLHSRIFCYAGTPMPELGQLD